jgi:hypothetical protein
MANLLPAGATTYAEFDPGDSTIKSVKRVPALFELVNKLTKAVQIYNQENPTVPVPAPTITFDDDARLASFTFSAPYKKVDEGGTYVDRALDYIGSYADWTVPTSGELDGLPSIIDALKYMVEWLSYINDRVVPNVIYNSLQGLITYTDNKSESQWDFNFTLPYNPITNNDGDIIKRAFNYPAILDEQEGLV